MRLRTVRSLAAYLDRPSQQAHSPLMLLRKGEGLLGPIALVHPVGGQLLAYRALVQALRTSRPVLGLRAMAPGLPLFASVEDMAAFYLHALRSEHSSDPFCLAGSSFGGMVAFEMARQLAARGIRVPLLVMIDTPGAEQIMAPITSESDILAHLAPQLASAGGAAALSSEELRRIVDVFRANDAAMRCYKPAGYDGSTLFLKAARRRPNIDPPNPEAPWRVVCRQFQIVDVPGDHVTLHVPPNVEKVAAAIDTALDGAAGALAQSDRPISAVTRTMPHALQD
jgi:thioesterase domain-containing protein